VATRLVHERNKRRNAAVLLALRLLIPTIDDFRRKDTLMTALKPTLGLCALVAACASAQPLPANYAPTQAAISAAEAVGAKNDPRAALHLKMARDQMVQAQSLAQQGDKEQAALVLDRARADAEVALMVTRETTARSEAAQANNQVQGLSRGNQ
jgi:hypothetical protein